MNDVTQELSPETRTIQEKVRMLESEIRAHPESLVEIPVRHYFATGLYVREITIPAGVLAIGKLHKTQHINLLLKGEVTMVTESGSIRVAAPYTWAVMPGKKAAAYAHSETVWTTCCVNPTDERDMAQLEAALIVPELHELGTGETPRLPKEE